MFDKDQIAEIELIVEAKLKANDETIKNLTSEIETLKAAIDEKASTKEVAKLLGDVKTAIDTEKEEEPKAAVLPNPVKFDVEINGTKKAVTATFKKESLAWYIPLQGRRVTAEEVAADTVLLAHLYKIKFGHIDFTEE